ncbi:shikimate kinase [Corticibacter populi]|uniref:Shikimate kinase n=1 Tax=Corticibacter populi TaxID=1550736 RepID=A0A3M6R086_9BURK|nr:shikimate kinase [Corticibacter populi]RMX08658.1 shikimate kinase [Corticibacter populi]RZS35995.1 shikimate kinase [Corticibacter populi]
MKIALIGMPAIGKTTLGRKLARIYGMDFVDLDHAIEEAIGCSIREYFDGMGEAAFRDVESRVLADHVARPGAAVLSTGGGIVLRPENRALLRQRCLVAYLFATPEVLLRRVRNDRTRPLLQVDDPLARLQELYAARHPLYQETADFHVAADAAGTRAVLAELQRHLAVHGLQSA